MPKKRNIHYVNNADFSHAVVEYVKIAESAKKNKKEVPKVTDYIATCFLKIAEGLSHKANFIRYTYREEMVMDAVENCLKAISNYNLKAATRTGKPNAFAYFTQITWFAFLRRIAKEKKQQEIKLKYLTQSGIENFISENENADEASTQVANSFVDSLRNRIDKVKTKDEKVKTITKQIKRRRKIQVDSDLQEFML
jgi:flagellar hook-basal body complex protein FliE